MRAVRKVLGSAAIVITAALFVPFLALVRGDGCQIDANPESFAIKDEVPRMNQHVAFGLNLFGAGAAEHYGTHAGLKRFQAFVLVREAVEVLGNSADRVDAFCLQYDEY